MKEGSDLNSNSSCSHIAIKRTKWLQNPKWLPLIHQTCFSKLRYQNALKFRAYLTISAYCRAIALIQTSTFCHLIHDINSGYQNVFKC